VPQIRSNLQAMLSAPRSRRIRPAQSPSRSVPPPASSFSPSASLSSSTSSSRAFYCIILLFLSAAASLYFSLPPASSASLGLANMRFSNSVSLCFSFAHMHRPASGSPDPLRMLRVSSPLCSTPCFLSFFFFLLSALLSFMSVCPAFAHSSFLSLHPQNCRFLCAGEHASLEHLAPASFLSCQLRNLD
jgi:hypothetical protein